MPLKTMAIELNTTPTPNLHAFPLTQTIWERGLAMISYFQAVRELDARWTGSLQFLPPPPTLRNEHDCIVARQIASTEIDLFHRYAREIASARRSPTSPQPTTGDAAQARSGPQPSDKNQS